MFLGLAAACSAAPARAIVPSIWDDAPIEDDPSMDYFEPNFGAPDTSGWYIGSIPDGEFEIPIVDRNLIDPMYHKQLVLFEGREAPGTIVVDTSERFLYLVRKPGTAIRYGIGVGRLGFTWSGMAHVKRRRDGPAGHQPRRCASGDRICHGTWPVASITRSDVEPCISTRVIEIPCIGYMGRTSRGRSVVPSRPAASEC
jgi:hypothetical protein